MRLRLEGLLGTVPAALAAVVLIACAPSPPLPAENLPVSRLDRARAYVKSYGHLRFFHPGDEAASIDWNRFAAVGAARILAEPAGDLGVELERLYRPIAPTAAILREARAAGDLRSWSASLRR